jgi:hypothetical protein
MARGVGGSFGSQCSSIKRIRHRTERHSDSLTPEESRSDSRDVGVLFRSRFFHVKSCMAHRRFMVHWKMISDLSALRTSSFLLPATLLLIAGIVVAQFSIPFGWALAGLYIAPVSLCALWSSFRHVFLIVWIATFCTILSTVVFFGSPFWDSKATMAMAYVLPVGSIWFIAMTSVVRKVYERRSQQRAKQQTLCSSCQRIVSGGKMFGIQEYATQRRGTFIGIGLCDECARKQNTCRR